MDYQMVEMLVGLKAVTMELWLDELMDYRMVVLSVKMMGYQMVDLLVDQKVEVWVLWLVDLWVIMY